MAEKSKKRYAKEFKQEQTEKTNGSKKRYDLSGH